MFLKNSGLPVSISTEQLLEAEQDDLGWLGQQPFSSISTVGVLFVLCLSSVIVFLNTKHLDLKWGKKMMSFQKKGFDFYCFISTCSSQI